MKRAAFIFLFLIASVTGCSQADQIAPLALAGTVPLAGVAGRIDHLAVDARGQRLFVAALENHSVEIVDLASGRRSGTLPGLPEPQGVLYLPEFNHIVVACAGDGSVRFYDGNSLQGVRTVDLETDADNLRYDPDAKCIYVGYGNGALGAIDAVTGKRVGDVDLQGHPESFQLETHGSKIFVNIPSVRQVAVIDRRKQAVIATWPLVKLRDNFAMALDEVHGRLFVACRTPAKLVVLDTETGDVVASADCAADADDLFYDAAAQRVYLSGGQGRIDVFEQTDADHYKLVSSTTTAAGARTSLLLGQLKSLYVACPHAPLGPPAELRQYKLP